MQRDAPGTEEPTGREVMNNDDDDDDDEDVRRHFPILLGTLWRQNKKLLAERDACMPLRGCAYASQPRPPAEDSRTEIPPSLCLCRNQEITWDPCNMLAGPLLRSAAGVISNNVMSNID